MMEEFKTRITESHMSDCDWLEIEENFDPIKKSPSG